MGNPFVHLDLQTPDPEKAKTFYGELLQWRLHIPPGMEEMGYTMIDVGEGTGGGIAHSLAPEAPSAWTPFIEVADVKATTRKAKELGATIVSEAAEIPNVGWVSTIEDPTGARVGFFQAKG